MKFNNLFFRKIMTETEPLLEKLHWEISQDNGHQYCVCEPYNQGEFENLLIHIKKHGYIVPVQGRPYFSVDIGEYLYWMMWDSVEKPNRINRMRI